MDNVSAADKAEFIGSLPKGYYAFAVPSGPKEAQVFRIYFRDVNPISDDFAKEILTAMITLVASVCSFYFGAGVAKSAQSGGPASPSPTITGVSPSKGLQGTSVPVLEITGSNLELVNQVTLSSGTDQAKATEVTSNATQVKCSLLLPSKPGKWSVIVATSDRKTAKLDDGFVVT